MLGTGLGFALLTADAADAEGIDFANFSVATEKRCQKYAVPTSAPPILWPLLPTPTQNFSRRHSRLVSTTTTLTVS